MLENWIIFIGGIAVAAVIIVTAIRRRQAQVTAESFRHAERLKKEQAESEACRARMKAAWERENELTLKRAACNLYLVPPFGFHGTYDEWQQERWRETCVTFSIDAPCALLRQTPPPN